MNPEKTINTEGYRLRRLEVYNWGSFNGSIGKMVSDGDFTVLTGDNGSGKTTIIDALLCLVSPHNHRKFNATSATSGGKADRDVRKYRLGLYGERSVETEEDGKGRYLRKPHEWSILLARFEDAGSVGVTLLIVFPGESEPLRYIGEADFSIDNLMGQNLSLPIVKPLLKSKFGDSRDATHYYREVRSRLGMHHERVQAIFAQLYSLRGFQDVGAFVRDYILPTNHPILEKLADLQKNYKDVRDLHQNIAKEEEALGLLRSVRTVTKQYDAAMEHLSMDNRVLKLAPTVMEHLRKEFLLRIIADTEKLHQIASDRKRAAMDRRVVLGEQKTQLDMQKRKLGSPIEEIDRALEGKTKQIGFRKKNRDAVRGYIGKDIGPFENHEEWLALCAKLEGRRSQAKKEIDQAKAEQEPLFGQKMTLQNRLNEVRSNLDRLRGGSSIPERLANIREDMARDLKMERQGIPFIAELMQVKAQEGKWRPTIEKLLHGFALGLLVPHGNITQADKWGEGFTRKGSRISFRPADANKPVFSNWPKNSVGSKLEFADHSFSGFLSHLIHAIYPHVCVSNAEEFKNHEKAISLSGQMFMANTVRHLDTYEVEFCLGWDVTARKIQLTSDNEQAEVSLAECLRKIEQRTRLIDEKESYRSNLARAVETPWEDLEINFLREEIEALEVRRADCLKNPDIARIMEELERTRGLIVDNDQAISEVDGELGVHGNAMEQYRSKLAKIPDEPDEIPADIIEAGYVEQWREYLSKEHGWSEYALKEQALLNDWRLKVSVREGELEREAASLYANISKYLKYLGETAASDDKAAVCERRHEMAEHADNIEQHGLPRIRQQFVDLFDRTVIGFLQDLLGVRSAFSRNLADEIAGINETLDKMPLNDYSRITLLVKKKAVEPATRFDNMAAKCVAGLSEDVLPASDDLEARYLSIRERYKLLDELLLLVEKDTVDARLMLDPRQWYDYGISEVSRETGVELNYLTGTSVLSAGEQKLFAYALMAATVHHHYGIAHNKASFRFCCLDEMMSNLGDNTTERALNYFDKLGIQLLIIHPHDVKLGIVADRIKFVNYAAKKERNSYLYSLHPTEADALLGKLT